MTLWMNTFCVSFLLYILAYLGNLGVVSNIPTLFFICLIGMTSLHILKRTQMVVAGPIARVFVMVLLLAIFFIVKQVVMSGGEGASLALKILLYHLVFMTGLLLGCYSPLAPERRTLFYSTILFFVPLIFFVIFAQGRPPSSALSVFNRNSFAGFTLIASALLLGFGTGRPLVSLRVYFVIVSAALVINSTLGALLAFLLAVMIYTGMQGLLKRRVWAGASVAMLAVFGASVYLVRKPDALAGVVTFDRLRFVYGTFANIFANHTGSWLEIDMGTAVRFAPDGELDMSAIFRLLHWIDIIRTLVSEGPAVIWLGGGTDWIELNAHRFTYNLAAHNEYVRLAVEQGLLYTLLIFAGLYAAAYSIRRNPLSIPLLATTIFLGSENLLNNFVATSMYFFFFAHTFAVERHRRMAGRRHIQANT